MAHRLARMPPPPARVPDLTALSLLVAIARTGNVGTAAHEVGLSVQAATARLRTVEQQVGAPVVERERRGRRAGRLTSRGVLLVEWAGPVLDAAADLDAVVAALRPARPGEQPIVLAAGPTAAEGLLPAWLVELRDGPGGQIVLLDTDDPAAAVRAGDATLGIVETVEPLEGLHATTVDTDTLVLVVAPDHPWAGGSGVDAAELVATPLVTRRPGAGTRASVEAALTAAAPDVRAPAPLREVAADTAVRAAVRAGEGPAVLPRRAVTGDLAAGNLAEVPVHGADLGREFRAVWKEGSSPQGTARDLLRIATGGRIR